MTFDGYIRQSQHDDQPTWERLPDRTTPEGETLHTEKAVIGDTTWHVGNIPPAPPRPRKRRIFRWWRR